MKTLILRLRSKIPAVRFMAAALLFFSSAFILTSCYKDRFNLNKVSKEGEWSPDVCAPLINSKLGMDDILNDYDFHNLHAEDGSGFLYLIYEDKVYSQSAEQWLVIPNQNVSTNYSIVLPGGLPYNAPAFDNNYEFVMPNGEKITEAYIKSGALNFNIPGFAFNQNASITVSIPGATKNGVPLNYTFNKIYAIDLNESIDLSGYRLVFDNTGLNNNMLKITYTATVTASGQTITAPLIIPMGETFTNLRYSSIYGDFKQHVFNLENDSVKIRLFQNVLHGSVDFQNPKMHFIANNSCGMPVDVNVTNFRALSYANAPYNIAITGTPVPWSVAAPTIGQIGQYATTQADFDRNNTNVYNAIYMAPEWFLSDVSALSNPAGGTSSNFLLDTSRFSVNVQVDIPLYGKALNFILQDTISFKFGQDMKNVDWMTFRINADNGFPVDAVMQIYFLSASNVFLDSLLIPAQQVISAAHVGSAPDYRVYDKIHTYTETTISQPRLNNLNPTEKILIRAVCNTVNNGSELTKFYSEYTLDVKLAARAKFSIPF
ncbi:MAG: hypothetical protein WCM76_11235 [Bacteroidota bacterium]